MDRTSRGMFDSKAFTALLAGFLFAAVGAGTARTEEPATFSEKRAIADSYVYKGGRDPFLPLAGQGTAWTAPTALSQEAEEFNVSSLELKGILTTRTGRWAVLKTTGGGSYLVKDGKIQDSKRKPLKGYVGIVKEKSLVVIGPNNQVTELKLKKDEGGEETPQ
ncbi:MAG TPA: hypothetical protein P5079_12070 [Elusimicrobiota bacterium]|nr:hypothetical protein [Elusimicrobiota bacterium]